MCYVYVYVFTSLITYRSSDIYVYVYMYASLLTKHMISTYSSITGCNFDLLHLFSLSSGGRRGGVGMCFVGKSEGECQGQQQEGQQQESAQQRKGFGGGCLGLCLSRCYRV